MKSLSKQCDECKKPIRHGEAYATCKSLEKEDRDREFYIHKACWMENYREGEGAN